MVRNVASAMREGLSGLIGLRGGADGPAVLAVVESARDLRLVEPVAAEFERINARTRFAICRLDGRGPVSPPSALPGAARLFLSRLDVRAVLVAGDRCWLPRNLAAAIVGRRIPAVWLSPEAEPAQPKDFLLDAIYSPRTHSVQQVASDLLLLAARDNKRRARKDFAWLRHMSETAAKHMEGEAKPAWVRRLGARIDSVDDLRQRLGKPNTILCLGNGPSSEDRAVLTAAHDVLFRIDYSWSSRGILCTPQVVFTHDSETMRQVSNAIFGLYGEGAENELLTTRLTRAWRKPDEYFLADTIADPYHEFKWGEHRPTSESVMIATAVSLVPQRLAIAGIDVAITAPGTQTAAKALASHQQRERQLAYVLGCLERHLGEVEILDDALSEAVRRRRSRSI